MKTVKVEASTTYDILIENGLIADCGKYISTIRKNCKIMIISDSTVFSIYGETVKSSLINEGFEISEFIIAPGEASKCADNLIKLWNTLANAHFTRSDVIVALGGGVVGDLSGFAASTYLRSIKYIQIPTTLLAMVDSSVGGKTAIDLDAGKNLAGTFYQPSMVLCDPEALKTLPDEIFSDGMAEVIKYGMINQPQLLDILENDYDISDVIEICVKAKRDIVNEDERDTGVRQLLNFGHTLAHGIELDSDYTIPHGRAVSVGMVLITKAAVKAGKCDKNALDILKKLLIKNSLPLSTDITADTLCKAALHDKKRAGGTITLVIPTKAGECILEKTPIENLYDFVSGAWDND